MADPCLGDLSRRLEDLSIAVSTQDASGLMALLEPGGDITLGGVVIGGDGSLRPSIGNETVIASVEDAKKLIDSLDGAKFALWRRPEPGLRAVPSAEGNRMVLGTSASWKAQGGVIRLGFGWQAAGSDAKVGFVCDTGLFKRIVLGPPVQES